MRKILTNMKQLAWRLYYWLRQEGRMLSATRDFHGKEKWHQIMLILLWSLPHSIREPIEWLLNQRVIAHTGRDLLVFDTVEYGRYEFRAELYLFFKHKIFKVPEAAQLSWPVIVVRCILFPRHILTLFTDKFSSVHIEKFLATKRGSEASRDPDAGYDTETYTDSTPEWEPVKKKPVSTIENKE